MVFRLERIIANYIDSYKYSLVTLRLQLDLPITWWYFQLCPIPLPSPSFWRFLHSLGSSNHSTIIVVIITTMVQLGVNIVSTKALGISTIRPAPSGAPSKPCVTKAMHICNFRKLLVYIAGQKSH